MNFEYFENYYIKNYNNRIINYLYSHDEMEMLNDVNRSVRKQLDENKSVIIIFQLYGTCRINPNIRIRLTVCFDVALSAYMFMVSVDGTHESKPIDELEDTLNNITIAFNIENNLNQLHHVCYCTPNKVIEKWIAEQDANVPFK